MRTGAIVHAPTGCRTTTVPTSLFRQHLGHIPGANTNARWEHKREVGTNARWGRGGRCEVRTGAGAFSLVPSDGHARCDQCRIGAGTGGGPASGWSAGRGVGRGRQVRPPGEGARVGVAPAVCGWFGLAGLRRRRAGFAWAPPLGRGPVGAGRVWSGSARPAGGGFSTGLSMAGVGMRR